LPGHALALVATVFLGGLFSATLVRLAPGFDVDEQQLDPHLNAESVQALRAARRQEHNIFQFYFSYMNRAAHGDLARRSPWASRCELCCVIALRSRCVLLAVGLGLGLGSGAHPGANSGLVAPFPLMTC